MVNVLQIIAAPTKHQDREIGINGPERRSANLVNRWQEFTIKPIVCYPRRGRLWTIFQEARIPLIDFEIKNKFDIGASWKIARMAQNHAVKVIHTQGPASLDALACLAGQIAHIPVMVSRPILLAHQIRYSIWRRKIYSVIDRFTLHSAARLIAVSLDGYAHLREVRHVPAHKLQVIYNGISLRTFASIDRSASSDGRSEAPVVLGMIAQLTAVKGWQDFIQVVHHLYQKGLNVKALIVGNGPLRSVLQADVLKKNIDHIVHFVGFQHEVGPFLSQMDILLFTSHREGLSVAIIEAMASGLPIVATDVGGSQEQVKDGYNGFILPVSQIEGMVMRCRELIVKPEMRMRMGKRSRQLAEEKFDEERMLKEYANCYHGLAKKKSRADE